MSSAPKNRKPVHRVDAVGLNCPMPVLMTRKALRRLPEGAVVEVLVNDPLARIDVPHFCAGHGHILLEESESGPILVFRLRKGPG